jgi:hypothetical protein
MVGGDYIPSSDIHHIVKRVPQIILTEDFSPFQGKGWPLALV